jgi:hypothetical protein
MRVLIVTICATVLTGAGATASTTPLKGAWGVVERGPIAPVCAAEQPCSAPARHVQLVFFQDGQAAARAMTDDNGKYRVPLRPGTYAVKLGTRSSSAGHDLEPRIVHALATRWVRVDFSLDTGIR